jgi:microcystin degradation protein MlrC
VRELVTIVRTIRGEIRPVMSLYDCRMIELKPRRAARPILRRPHERARRQKACSVSLAHGFKGATPEIGTRVLRSRTAPAAGDALAAGLARSSARSRPVRAAGGAARPSPRSGAGLTGNRPSVIADSTDNAGGARPDNTNIIHRPRERGIRDVAIGPIWDPVAVGFCLTAGVGAIPLRFGGKVAATSGTPVDGR